MERLNLTLDSDTADALTRYAKKRKTPRATLARELLREALDRRDAIERQKKLAQDYAGGRADARALLVELEGPQLDWAGVGIDEEA